MRAEPERYVRILDGELVVVVRYHDDRAAPWAWGGPRVVVAGGPPGAFVGPTEVFVGDRVVRHRSGDLRVVRPFHFHSLYRWPTA